MWLPKYGESRYPDLTLLDLRLSKIFNLKRYGKVEIMLDGFNIFNAHTPLSWDDESWEGYKQVTEILAPRIFRLGVKWNF